VREGVTALVQSYPKEGREKRFLFDRHGVFGDYYRNLFPGNAHSRQLPHGLKSGGLYLNRERDSQLDTIG